MSYVEQEAPPGALQEPPAAREEAPAGGGEAHMAVDGDTASELAAELAPDQHSVRNVTFLYTAVPGAAPSSFGLNVARMAGLPDDVLCRAAELAARLQCGSGRVSSSGGGVEEAAEAERVAAEVERVAAEVRVALGAADLMRLRALRAEAARLLFGA